MNSASENVLLVHPTYDEPSNYTGPIHIFQATYQNTHILPQCNKRHILQHTVLVYARPLLLPCERCGSWQYKDSMVQGIDRRGNVLQGQTVLHALLGH